MTLSQQSCDFISNNCNFSVHCTFKSMFVITSVGLFQRGMCVIYSSLKCMIVNTLAQTWTTAARDWRTPLKCQEPSSSIQSQSGLNLPVVYSLNPCDTRPVLLDLALLDFATRNRTGREQDSIWEMAESYSCSGSRVNYNLLNNKWNEITSRWEWAMSQHPSFSLSFRLSHLRSSL